MDWSEGKMIAWVKAALHSGGVSSSLPWLRQYLGKEFTTIENFPDDSGDRKFFSACAPPELYPV